MEDFFTFGPTLALFDAIFSHVERVATNCPTLRLALRPGYGARDDVGPRFSQVFYGRLRAAHVPQE
jgi:hypothetical protein